VAVGVKEVISAHVVLIHRLLDQTHPQRLGVEGEVGGGVGGDGRQVVEAGQFWVHRISFRSEKLFGNCPL
jgi:hypothetical protein